MRVIITKDYDEMSKWAANYVASKIIEANPTPEKPFVLGCPTGSSPLGLYKQLIKIYESGKLSFKNVITFNMDEYVNLPEDHPESYHSFMWTNFFSKIDIKKENVHILNGNAPDLMKECEDYEKAIEAAGGIDLFMGGCGVDGHIAFNEPYTSLNSRTGVRALTEDTRIVNSRFFGNDPEATPPTALSVGVGTVCDSREVLLLVNGHNKARALAHCIEGGVSSKWTISALQLHNNAVIACDDAACGELKLDTYNYFRDVYGEERL